MFLSCAGLALAQQPQLAVVSIKRNNAECCTGYGIGRGGAHATHVTLKALIGLAYRIPPGGPSWIGADGFDVECKADDGNDPAADAPTVFTAVQEQTGLKLNPAKGPVETYVVDRAERPGPN